jgi:hypothetical protein
MKFYSVFDKATGLFTGRTIGIDAAGEIEAHLARNISPGLGSVEGKHDHLARRVDLGKMNAEHEAHSASHRARVDTMRTDFVPLGTNSEFTEPPEPLFLPTSGVVVDYQPPAPSPDHEWSIETKRWKLSAVAQQRKADQATARARIAELERDVQPQLLRAVALGQDGAKEKLAALDSEIARLRG